MAPASDGTRVTLVRPTSSGPHDGNRTTAERWGELLTRLGCRVRHLESWDGEPADLFVALHARKSHASVVRFRRAFPKAPLVVCGTGTDLYTDVKGEGADEARESFGLATRIVVLQSLAVDALPPELRERAQVIHQSVSAPERPIPKAPVFQVAFLANLRPVKDPETALAAAERLHAAGTALRVVHAGGAIDAELGERVAAVARTCPAFETRGELPRPAALELLGSSHLLLSTSRHEGGANVVSEALAYDVPVVASRIPGNLGLLGEDYPGTFPVGDAEACAALLARAAAEPAFLEELRTACRERAWRVDPRTELEGWRRLLAELLP